MLHLDAIEIYMQSIKYEFRIFTAVNEKKNVSINNCESQIKCKKLVFWFCFCVQGIFRGGGEM